MREGNLYMRYVRLGWAVLALAFCGVARADEYNKVTTAELRDNPKSYWARGIVFSDVLEAVPEAKQEKIGDRRYLPVQLRALGTCYVDVDLEEKLRGLTVGDEYVYAGSVYQQDSGVFFSKSKFYVVIKRISKPIKGTEDLVAVIREALSERLAESPYAAPFRSLNEVLASAQKELEAYSATSNLQVEALFAADSLHANRVGQAVRQALVEQERSSRIPIPAFTVNLVTALLAIRNGALTSTEPPTVEAPAPVTEPEAVPQAEPQPEMPAAPETVVMQPEPVAEPEPAPAVVPAEPAPAAPEEIAPEAAPAEVEAPVTQPDEATPTALPAAKIKLPVQP